MKKTVLMVLLLILVGGGAVLAQSRSARSADDDTQERSRSRSRSKKELTRSEKKALAKEQKRRAKELKKQQAELEKVRKQQAKALKDQERARAKQQRQLARKARRSLDDEEFASRKRSKKHSKKLEIKKKERRVKSKARKERSKVRSAKKVDRPEKHVRSRWEEHSRSVSRSAERARKLEREQRRARQRQEAEERKRREQLRHEEKKQERAQRLVDLRIKDLRKKEEHRRERDRRTETARQLTLKERKRVDDHVERLAFARQDRAEKMNRWKELHNLEVIRDYDAGRYADVCKLPAWPVASWFFENKDLLNVSVSYKYATDAYADDRRRVDVTGIEFGYKPIQLQDVLLASKLVRNVAAFSTLSPIEKAVNVALVDVNGLHIANPDGTPLAASTIAGTDVAGGTNLTQAAVNAIKGALLAGKDAAGIAQAAYDVQAAIVANTARDAMMGTADAAHAHGSTVVAFMQKFAAGYKDNVKVGRDAAKAEYERIAALGVQAGAVNAIGEAMLAAADKVCAEDYLHYLGNQLITLNGKVEEYGTSIDFARYVMGKNVALGVQVPVLYRKNTLTADIATSVDAKTLLRHLAELQQVAGGPFTFMAERYGAEPSLLLRDMFQAKGAHELGGSATGLGDIVLFASAQTGARTFEKVLAGLKVTLPTGKKATTAKLWAPELGTGHTQFSAYTSLLMDYNRLLNPHVYVEGTYSMAAHEDKRVPAHVVKSANTALAVAGQAFTIAAANPINNTQDVIAFGDRVKPVNDQNFDLFDTSIKGMGDKAISVRMIRGLQFKARVGNVIEKFIFRRGFLDLYYDLHVKFKDSAHGHNIQDYNMDIVSDRTDLMAHRIGTEFTYQFDPYARWRVGAVYTFAGINAPKTFELSSALGYSF